MDPHQTDTFFFSLATPCIRSRCSATIRNVSISLELSPLKIALAASCARRNFVLTSANDSSGISGRCICLLRMLGGTRNVRGQRDETVLRSSST